MIRVPDPAGPRRLVDVETIRNPSLYSPAQVRRAFDVCFALNRGKLVLAEEPDA